MLAALPLSVFQLLGHILSAFATSKIPVSLVHTIKGLSPLFTVLAYRLFFRIRYARATYLSLIPLTAGVMLACSADFSTNMVGITCSFVATVVFVTQNIFSKKLFNEAARAESGDSRKLDKLNLLCYCSAGAFILTAPVWLLFEGFPILSDFFSDGKVDLSSNKNALDHGRLTLEFFFNGVFHFGQNILAFILLSMLSPVSYSVASLIKRVWVVVIAILWFGSSTTTAQGLGIFLTFIGLYLYDRNSMDDAAERRAKADIFRQANINNTSILPLTEDSRPNPKQSNGHINQPHPSTFRPQDLRIDYSGQDIKRADDIQQGIGNNTNPPVGRSSLLPGATQESTWRPGDAIGETGKKN
ncbi:putative er to golgi transport protein [Phaeomoniella chlamydospora]|uniref:Putative er to golgi transport protein n=1 Tax=Phaeomoniella chlamydospora TaxID=158046 RepID=A0A0G2GFY9_PHACM|nr:putative er to golgi transport protein [Phaeomoniella chlamydospora]